MLYGTQKVNPRHNANPEPKPSAKTILSCRRSRDASGRQWPVFAGNPCLHGLLDCPDDRIDGTVEEAPWGETEAGDVGLKRHIDGHLLDWPWEEAKLHGSPNRRRLILARRAGMYQRCAMVGFRRFTCIST